MAKADLGDTPGEAPVCHPGHQSNPGVCLKTSIEMLFSGGRAKPAIHGMNIPRRGKSKEKVPQSLRDSCILFSLKKKMCAFIELE